MKLLTQKYLNRIGAVATWLDGNAELLKGVERVATLKTQLQTQRAAIESLALEQEQQGGGASQSVARKSELRDALSADLIDIARTARVMEQGETGIAEKFRLPDTQGEQAFLATARVFAANALPLKKEFVSYGMASDFLDDLDADVSAFATLLAEIDSATQNRISAHSGLDVALSDSSQTIDALDAIVRNVLRGNALKLSDWSRAKRLDISRAHRQTPPTPTPPSTPNA